MKSHLVRAGVAVLAAVALAGCDDSTSPDGRVQLTVLLTDAPSMYLANAEVDIGSVELTGGEGGPVVLSEDATDGFVDLLELQGLATKVLADLEIPAGTYSQLRLMVEGARVELATGYAFTSGGTTADLTVPSGAQTGIKLNLKDADAEENQGGVEITGGQTVLVVDFDVNQSFVIQGNAETPAGIKGVLFKPTLRVVVADIAGSISGTVSTELAGFDLSSVVVKATPVDGTTLEPYQSLTGSATVDAADGSYTIYYLVPGDYEVSVTVDPGDTGEVFTADPVSVTVGESASVTGVNFVIVQG
jgi:hypothetical protein